MDPLVSILMPIKNAMPYLVACLDSIMNQTFQKWELVAVDDHCADDSHQVLQKYAAWDQRIKIVRLEKDNGIIAALRCAYANCTGLYFTRMDADDLMSRSKLELFYKKAIVEEKGSVITGKVKYFRDGGIAAGYRKYEKWINRSMDSENPWQHIYKECVIPSPNWLLHRLDLEAIGAFESNVYPEDYDLCFRMKEGGLKVSPVQEVTHYWRDYSQRTSRTDSNYADNRFLELKLDYFTKQDYSSKIELRIWGAGRKGKEIAAYLINQQIPFMWFSKNPNKIGHQILGKEILPQNLLLTSEKKTQTIIAFANESEQSKAKILIDSHLYPDHHKVLFFC